MLNGLISLCLIIFGKFSKDIDIKILMNPFSPISMKINSVYQNKIISSFLKKISTYFLKPSWISNYLFLVPYLVVNPKFRYHFANLINFYFCEIIKK